MSALLQDMGIDHGCRDILMAKPRLKGSDVGSFFKKLGGKTVAKGMGTDFFRDLYFIHHCFDRFGILDVQIVSLVVVPKKTPLTIVSILVSYRHGPN